ncbi:MAG: hypothetical protein R3C49_04840 [Planctomycetaceae bacterium]
MNRAFQVTDGISSECLLNSQVPATFLLLMIVAILTTNSTTARGQELRIVPAEPWSTAFAGEELRLAVRVTSVDDADGAVPKGRLQWSHSFNRRTISSGEAELQADNNGSATAELVLKPATVRDGVIIATRVTADLVDAQGKATDTRFEQTLWLFPSDPLTGRSEWAKSLQIELFDPVGRTAKLLDDLQLPYQLIHHVGAPDATQQKSILIIAEDVSLVRNRALSDQMLQAAMAGRRVLVLAPADGGIVLPGMDDRDDADSALPGEIRFARQTVITELDKRLDASAWLGAGPTVPFHGLRMGSRRGRIEASVSLRSTAWPWLRIGYPQTGGALIFCGFRVIEHAHHGPTPRYLLIRILESLSDSHDEQ